MILSVICASLILQLIRVADWRKCRLQWFYCCNTSTAYRVSSSCQSAASSQCCGQCLTDEHIVIQIWFRYFLSRCTAVYTDVVSSKEPRRPHRDNTKTSTTN